MKHVILLFAIGIFTLVLIACEENKTNKTEKEVQTKQDGDSSTSQPPITYEGCYLYVNNQDSISLQLQQSNRTISGWLNYDFHEKDGSFGKVQGIAIGDTLQLHYTFLAEGQTSKREIYYVYKNEGLYEGTGESELVNESMEYINPDELNYNSGFPLKRVNCSEQFIKEDYIQFYEDEMSEE